MQYLFCLRSYLGAKLKLLHPQVELSARCWVTEEKRGWWNAALLDQNFPKVLGKWDIHTWEISQTPSCLLCDAKMEAGSGLAMRDYASRIASWCFVSQKEHNGGMAAQNSVLPTHCSAPNRCLHWYCPCMACLKCAMAKILGSGLQIDWRKEPPRQVFQANGYSAQMVNQTLKNHPEPFPPSSTQTEEQV